MNVAEAFEKAQRILVEEQSKPTLRYKYVECGPSSPGSGLMAAATRLELSSEREGRPRKVHEDPTEFKFESLNFDLLVTILNQVTESQRPNFIGSLLKFVEKPFPAQRADVRTVPSVNHESSMLPLIAEFCVRTGHLNKLLEATKVPKFPTSSLAMLVMELEEMVALNFNLFSGTQLEAMPKELAVLRENAELQTYSSRSEKRGGPQIKNPKYRPGSEHMGRAVVAGLDGLREECRKARYFYLKGALQELPNLEIESDKLKVAGFLDSLGFDALLAASLTRAEQQYSSASGPFDWKDCLGHIRSFYEHMNIDAGQALAKSVGTTCVDKWDPTLTFFRNSKFFTEQQDKFARGLYTLLSDEGVHPLIAEKEFARLLRNMVIEYGLMFLTMLEKKGIKI
jgi:hypothetical protein